MKKLGIVFLSLCILLTSFPSAAVAHANEVPEAVNESSFLKDDEIMQKLQASYENRHNQVGGVTMTNPSNFSDMASLLEKSGMGVPEVTVEEKSAEELQAEMVGAHEAIIQDITVDADSVNEDFQAEFDEFVNTKIEDVNLEASTYAISYYPGTTIPTYTYVTGLALRDTVSNEGAIGYVYNYYDSEEPASYMAYLVTYCGWTDYTQKVASDYSYVTYYFVKGSDMMSVTVNFQYGYTMVAVNRTTSTTVNPTSVSLDISSRTMIVGNEYPLTATVNPSNATDTSITWSSSNSSVASVSSAGRIIAKAAGSATITAKTSNGKTATCSITVKNFSLAYYTGTTIPTYTCVTGRNVLESTVYEGLVMHFYDLDLGSYDDYGRYLTARDGFYLVDQSWSDDGTSYISIFSLENGNTLMLTCDLEDNYIAVVYEDTSTVSVTGISLDKTSAQMTVGSSLTLYETITPSNATNKNVTWTSSNTNVATVSSYGTVTAKAAGTATITVKTEDGSKTATCYVTVVNASVAVTGISLNKTSTTLYVGDTEALTATITPSNATNKNVTWSSSNSSVASVSSSGVVTAKVAGTATITAKTEDGDNIATCIVEVKEISPVIEVESAYGQAGKTVDVTINLLHNPGIALVGFDVNYDSSVMTLKSATLGEIFTGELECNIAAVPFVFNVYSGTSNKTASGKLVTLRFEIKENCPDGDYNITLSNIETLNIDENKVDFEWTNGKITVRDAMPGDITGDGQVTRTDLLRLAKHFSGYVVEIDEVAADVTGDGQVTRTDLLRLAKHFSGYDVELGR